MKSVIYICILFFALSCGTRKKQLQVETYSKDVSLLEQKDITTNAKIKVSEKETVYEPVDPDKPMTLPDGRKTTNAKITDRETVKDSVGQKVDKSKTDFRQNVDTTKKDLDLETKKANPYLWLAIAVVICFALYFARRWVNSKKP